MTKSVVDIIWLSRVPLEQKKTSAHWEATCYEKVAGKGNVSLKRKCQEPLPTK